MPKASSLLLIITALFITVRGSSEICGYGNDSVKTIQTATPSPEGTKSTSKVDSVPPQQVFVLKPIIGLGVGLLTYSGNVKMNGSYWQPLGTSRLGYDLTFAQKLSEHTEFNLYFVTGQVSEYERSLTFNWNFESQISGGGIHFLYKILPHHDISPYFLIGLESFEYLSRTDMYDAYGNKYYYWNDGTIRSLPQTASNASTATILTPDYTFETDIRGLNLDGSGKYTEQTFAIPIGIGLMLHINKKADFTMGTTLHYTFTDHIDGLTPNGTGTLKGPNTHDMFFMTAVGLRYDLTPANHIRGPQDEDQSRYDTVNFANISIDDTIKEAVADTTPISDSLAKRQYEMYEDSTGQFATVYYDSSTITGGYGKPSKSGGYASGGSNNGTDYSIEIGHYTKGVPASDMDKLLSVPDVKSTMLKDSSTIYTAGDYSSFDAAKQRQEQLAKQGVTDTKIVYHKGNDLVPVDKPVEGGTSSGSHGGATANGGNKTGHGGTTSSGGSDKGTGGDKGTSEGGSMPTDGAVVYRIQLGAFKHKISSSRVFNGAKNVVEIKTENGLYTYSVGAYGNYKDAAVYKTQLVTEGYSDAFIKAYKNGKRIDLTSAGVMVEKPEKLTKDDSTNIAESKSQIQFKVQLGAFKGAPPKDMQAKFKQFSNLGTDQDAAGLTHYNVGPYADYASAKAMKDKVIAAGISGAFIVAYMQGHQISLQEAMRLMKQ